MESSKEDFDQAFIESEDRINRLKEGIQNAMTKRDYDKATSLQGYLKKEMVVYNKLVERKQKELLECRVVNLEGERDEELGRIDDVVNAKLSDIKESYTLKYDELQIAHHDNLEQLQDKFSSNTYTSIRMSSTVRALQKSEDFYARSGDFQSAAQIRRQIQAQIQKEVQDFELSTKTTIEAKIRDAVTVYQNQQRTFVQKLHNEKNILKREISKKILGIENKYKKRFHDLTGKSEAALDLTGPFKESVFARIDQEFVDFIKEVQNMYKIPGEITEETGSARQSRQSVSAPRTRSIGAKTTPVVTRQPRNQGSSTTKSITTPRAMATTHAPNSRNRTAKQRPRNPRVDMALSRANRNIDLAKTAENK